MVVSEALWNNLKVILVLSINSAELLKGINAESNFVSTSAHLTVVKFLKNLQHLHNYDTVLLMHNRNSTFGSVFYANAWMEGGVVENEASSYRLLSSKIDGMGALEFAGHLMPEIQVGVLQSNEFQSLHLKGHLGEYLLAVLQIDVNSEGIQKTLDEHRELLKRFRQNVQLMTIVKVVLLINYPVALIDRDVVLVNGVVDAVLRHCWQQRFINVIAILSNYKLYRVFYRFDPFPTFYLESSTMAFEPDEQAEVFPRRLSNLKGYKMPIIIGGTEPRIIPYFKPDGKLFLGGFVGHFLLAFAKRYNCILHEPIPFNPVKIMPSQDLMKAVFNGTVEWSSGITYPTIPFIGYSYPYEMLNWCIMIPLEPDIPGYKFFTSVFKGEAYVLVIGSLITISMVLSAALYLHGHSPDYFDVFFHGDCLRGLLGQSFSEIPNPPKIVRAIYLEICILGILLTTAYNAYFSTYVTKAPKEVTRNTFDDVLASGLKVIAFEPEYKEVLGRAADLKKYTRVFITEANFLKYVQQRDSFDTKFGYVVPTTKWTIVNEQQKIFTTPLFKQTTGLCFFNSIPMCFPIQQNSIFNDLLYQLILEVYQSGLMHFWRQYNFLELIRADKLALSDLSPKKEFTAMKVDDLQYIFVFMSIMLLTVTVVFAGELLMFYRIKIYRKITNIFVWKGTKRTIAPTITYE